jgi:iron-sulfur cluster insertion protein
LDKFILPVKHAVTLLPNAIKHFDNIAAGKTVKFGVEGGGCAGFQYHWQIITDQTELYADDEITDYDTFKFAVDGSSLMMLIGSSVDYLSDITGSHIEIINPLAKAGCGCGVSVNF